MSDAEAKYDALADSWSGEAYADSAGFYRRRADVVAALGGRLRAGASILELGCADGGLSEVLVTAGFILTGMDVSARMIELARRRVPEGATFGVGDLNTYEPPEPVAATIGFRVLPYVDDLATFFARAASFSTEKIVFDLVPSTGPTLATVRSALEAAGLERIEVRPWLLPARTRIPRVGMSVVSGVERVKPVALAITRRRFSVVVAASTR
jgi:predicted TPR repeat methyltransferase